jgi:hypothetical protein
LDARRDLVYLVDDTSEIDCDGGIFPVDRSGE